ncbi:MAG: hypothetical protein Q9175_000396 [Cornicularia normoerica]
MDPLPGRDAGDGDAPPLSKNKLKKLKRDQEWEANRAKRKEKRREKQIEKKQRKRAARQESAPNTPTNGMPVHKNGQGKKIAESKNSTRYEYTQVPITLVLDCGFDDLMIDKELKSLGSQVTRAYSDNHKAPLQAHLAISSFGGQLKERFDGLLAGHYRSWKNVRFLEGDYVQAAEQAKEWMKGEHGGKLAGALAKEDDSAHKSHERDEAGEVVYLTSDSPDTLTELRPYSTYIIGGLVDRNRHKGVCYNRAMDRGMRTAKLPIGVYMQMTSRFVLATNHVAEIMLRWLELGDWGKAFLAVMPKRKGGVLKPNIEDPDDEADGGAMDDENMGAETSDRKAEEVEAETSKQEDGFGSTSDGECELDGAPSASIAS